MTAESVHRDLKKKPNDSHANWLVQLALVEGYLDLCSFVSVRANGCHIFVPEHVVPFGDKFPIITTATEVLQFGDICDATSALTITERRLARAAAAPGSAALMVYEGEMIGMRYGVAGAYMGLRFRKRPPMDATVVVLTIHLYWAADMLATAIMLGEEGQSPHKSLTHRCTAAGFKAWALGEAVEPERFDRATLDVDSSKFDGSTAKSPTPVNGVTARCLLPPGFPLTHVVMALHTVVLGPVNCVNKAIRLDCMRFDSVDKAAVEGRLEEVEALSKELWEVNGNVMRAVRRLMELLGESEVRMVYGDGDVPGGDDEEEPEGGAGEGGELGGAPPEIQVRVAEPGAEPRAETEAEAAGVDYAALALLATTKAKSLREEAARSGTAHIEAHAASRRGEQALSGRMQQKYLREGLEAATPLGEKASELETIATGLSADVERLLELQAEYEKQVGGEGQGSGGGMKGVVLAAYEDSLRLFGVHVQRYWLSTLCGRDAGRLVEKRKEILAAVKPAIVEAGYTSQEADDFIKKHLAVLDPLCEIIHLTRIADRSLTRRQEAELEALCPKYLEGRRGVLDGKVPTPKDMAVAFDVPYYAKLLHTLGLLGTDGLEHLHQMITAAKILTRSIRNRELCAATTAQHIQMKQQTCALGMAQEAEERVEREAKKARKE